MSDSRPSHESAPGIRFLVDELGVVRTTYSGAVGYAQMVLHLQEHERAGVLARPQVVDAREATLALSAAEVQAFASLTRELRLRTSVGPTAVVATADLVYGIARMYGAFDDSDSFAVFRSMAEAEAWIGGRQQGG